MTRILVAVLAIVALAAGAAWFADRPGQVTLDWQTYRIETSVAVAVFLVAALVGLAAVAYRLWIFLKRGPRAFGQTRLEHRRQQGFETLTRGLIAIAAGEGAEAQKLARQAARLLDRRAPILLLTAQAAELSGDSRTAEAAYRKMLEEAETEFLGLRGLIGQAIRAGDRAGALALARRAAALKPDAHWLLRERLTLEAGTGDWIAAGETFERALRLGALETDDVTRLRAVLLLERARAASRDGLQRDALTYAVQAAETAPDFVPAQIEAADRLRAEGKMRRAARLLEQAWNARPHPEIGEAYMRLYGDGSTVERLRRAETLYRLSPDTGDARALLAEALLAVGEAKTAEPVVASLRQREGETRRVCALMAGVEKAEWGDSRAAHDWLTKAEHAPVPAGWQCAACGARLPVWSAHCPECQAFALIDWVEIARAGGRAAARALAEPSAPAPASTGLAQSPRPPYGPPAQSPGGSGS